MIPRKRATTQARRKAKRQPPPRPTATGRPPRPIHQGPPTRGPSNPARRTRLAEPGQPNLGQPTPGLPNPGPLDLDVGITSSLVEVSHTRSAGPGLPDSVCRTRFAGPGLPDLVCRTRSAGLGLPDLVCRTRFAGLGLPGLVCSTVCRTQAVETRAAGPGPAKPGQSNLAARPGQRGLGRPSLDHASLGPLRHDPVRPCGLNLLVRPRGLGPVGCSRSDRSARRTPLQPVRSVVVAGFTVGGTSGVGRCGRCSAVRIGGFPSPAPPSGHHPGRPARPREWLGQVGLGELPRVGDDLGEGGAFGFPA
ncbi:hypothetical protein Actkin_01658 [Actinokineospora sp. UTMC 2448]|nr:hypothetical protein Actkin_01658 [Actinokineospora sp. UTMC 2448]